MSLTRHQLACWGFLPAERRDFLERLIANGGPEPAEYEAFTAWTNALAVDVAEGKTTADEVRSLWHKITTHVFRGTAQADVC